MRGGRAAAAFMHPPTTGRAMHPAGDAQARLMEVFGALSPAVIAAAPRVLQGLQRGGESRRAQQLALVEGFGEAAGGMSNADVESLVSTVVQVSAVQHGTWSREYRRASQNVYMCLLERRHSGGLLPLLASLASHADLPTHADLALAPGLAVPPGGWESPPPLRDRTAVRHSLQQKWEKQGKGLGGWSVEDVFLLLDPSDEKRFTPLHWFCEREGFTQLWNKEGISSLA
eukprot:Hpha_TRINITY_DN24811_c0_g1::TRINITY_DN24811_c0_g1_i1::g.97340::m.97340